MGSWGYGPFDSDQALDWYGDIEGEIVSAIKKLCHQADDEDGGSSWYGHELRAAAEINIRLGGLNDQFGSDFDVNLELINRLQELLDSNWHCEWNEPNEMRECIQGQIDKLREIESRSGKDVD